MSPLWKKKSDPGELAGQAALRGKIYRVQAAAVLDPPEVRDPEQQRALREERIVVAGTGARIGPWG